MKFDGIRFELSITPDYVANWGFKEAIRELIQNGVDAQTADPNCEFSLEYDDLNGEVLFINQNSTLPINSMLLGKTTKKDDKNSVGQFGEGYKIAALVLTRLGKTFEVDDNRNGKWWTASIAESERFDGEDVLCFDVYKAEDDKTDRLVIIVGGVTIEEFMQIEDIWLNFEDNYDDVEKYETEYGDIILDPNYAGNVYVNGIYIQSDKTLKYGYNFKPEHIELERDRSTCRHFNLRWATSEIMAQAVFNDVVDISDFIEMLSGNSEDAYFSAPFRRDSTIAEKIMAVFDSNHPDSIPVDNQERFNMVKKFGGVPILVPDDVFSYIEDEAEGRIKKLIDEYSDDDNSLYNKFYVWFANNSADISEEGKEEFMELLSMLVQ